MGRSQIKRREMRQRGAVVLSSLTPGARRSDGTGPRTKTNGGVDEEGGVMVVMVVMEYVLVVVGLVVGMGCGPRIAQAGRMAHSLNHRLPNSAPSLPVPLTTDPRVHPPLVSRSQSLFGAVDVSRCPVQPTE